MRRWVAVLVKEHVGRAERLRGGRDEAMTRPVSITVLLLLRFLKLCAVFALGAGTAGAFVPRALEDRRRFAYLIAAPGLFGTWGAGLATALGTGVSPLAAWIVGAVIASTIAGNVVLWAVARDGRRSWGAASISIVALLISVALMVWKPVLS